MSFRKLLPTCFRRHASSSTPADCKDSGLASFFIFYFFYWTATISISFCLQLANLYESTFRKFSHWSISLLVRYISLHIYLLSCNLYDHFISTHIRQFVLDSHVLDGTIKEWMIWQMKISQSWMGMTSTSFGAARLSVNGLPILQLCFDMADGLNYNEGEVSIDASHPPTNHASECG